jgi:hypothetical protein
VSHEKSFGFGQKAHHSNVCISCGYRKGMGRYALLSPYQHIGVLGVGTVSGTLECNAELWLSRCPLLLEFALATLKIALNGPLET